MSHPASGRAARKATNRSRSDASCQARASSDDPARKSPESHAGSRNGLPREPQTVAVAALMVTGGCRSGKSAFALREALTYPGPRAFLATADPEGDAEMQARIVRHQRERGPEWLTLPALTEPLPALHKAAAAGCGVALLDSVTTWIANLMLFHGEDDAAVLEAVRQLASALTRPSSPAVPERALFRPGENSAEGKSRHASDIAPPLAEAGPDSVGQALPVILVTDEVGLGLVPETPLGRRFRDLLGEANQILAAVCDRVVFCVSGLPLVLKGPDKR